jgi:hypothetical protein
LAPGYLLLRDAVSTPRSYLTDAALGLTEAAPRALPQDFAVALASHVVDGGVVVKLSLIAGLWLSGWGAAGLAALVVPASGLGGQFVAATVAVWNPYVAERLLQGHWSLLVGYGCLPWIAAAVLRLRRHTAAADGGRSWWAVLCWIALAGLTPTGLLLAVTVALVCCAAPGPGRSRWRCAAASLGAAVLGALPWLVAPVLAGSLSLTQAAGVPQFAARAEPGLGTLGTLAGLGGIWNGQAVPDSRTTAFAAVATAVLLVVVCLGVPAVVRRPGAVPLLVLAAVAVVAPALMATGPGLAALEGITRAVPGLGVLRDGQKWVALATPGYAVAGAGAVATVANLHRRLPGGVTAAVCCLAVLAVLPDLAWGVGGKMTPVRYPAGWSAAAALVNADPRPVAVLPPDSMRHYPWAGDAPVLDPLPRWVSADVLTTGDLVIGGQTVPGEGERARAVQRLLLSGAGADELAGAGVGWVVVEGGGDAGPRLALPVAFADGDIVVYRVGGDRPAASHRAAMIVAHVIWLAALCAGAAGMASTRLGARRRARSEPVDG